jgi:hypothetical protein
LFFATKIGNGDRDQRIDARCQVEGEASDEKSDEGEPQSGPERHFRADPFVMSQEGFLVDGLGP